MDLRSCYFCGTVGDALDTYALPRDDDTDPVRVTLCTDCHAKLDRVLDAVAGGPVGRADGETDPAGTAEDSPSNAADATFRGTGEVTFGDPAAAAETGGDDEADGGTERADAAGSEGESAEAAGSEGSSTETIEREEASTEATAKGSGSTEATESGPASEDVPDGETPDDGSDATGGLRGLDPDDRGQVATYRKALRLLQNREFPMERAAVVDLLGSAYDLDRSECNRLLDFAVEKELLVEEGDELRRP